MHELADSTSQSGGVIFGQNSIEKMQITESFVFSKDRDVQAIGRIAKKQKLDRSSNMSKRPQDKAKFKSISPVNIDSNGVLPETNNGTHSPFGVIQGEKKVIGVKKKPAGQILKPLEAPPSAFKKSRESGILYNLNISQSSNIFQFSFEEINEYPITKYNESHLVIEFGKA